MWNTTTQPLFLYARSLIGDVIFTSYAVCYCVTEVASLREDQATDLD